MLCGKRLKSASRLALKDRPLGQIDSYKKIFALNGISLPSEDHFQNLKLRGVYMHTLTHHCLATTITRMTATHSANPVATVLTAPADIHFWPQLQGDGSTGFGFPLQPARIAPNNMRGPPVDWTQLLADHQFNFNPYAFGP
ncbi:hypothetical protein CBOM_07060 [Ceraceosorus bombacis]|uniref:Uncharacterized protein n=1 Tax=Ceraceosorus bombacis TaxID=401625 RepID=A0A0P1BKY0_9BASI|nr:hypothetical protein CBOM_07060 [Ceraceosorus bombacis]